MTHSEARRPWEVRFDLTILEKSDEERIAYGWAIVCRKAGEPYYDSQGDHIPEDAMHRAIKRFMAGNRIAKVQHEGDQQGRVLYGFPLSAEVKKALGLSGDVDGWAVGVEFEPAAWRLVKAGKIKGFSIGGYRIDDETVEEV